MIRVTELSIPGVLLLESQVFLDSRGFFRELWNSRDLQSAGISTKFVQDNVAASSYSVVRGLHLQEVNPQTKLVTAVDGEIYDVAVDVRPTSPTFGQHVAVTLSAEKGSALLIPAGFAHGYQVLSPRAVVVYKCSAFYDPTSEVGILWDDPSLGIEWPLADAVLSSKDRSALPLERYRARTNNRRRTPALAIEQ